MSLIQTDQMYPVIAGPSKFDLMLNLFDGESGTRFMYFDIKTTTYVTGFIMYIKGVHRENGSGESWMIYGYNADFGNISVHFSTKDRQGSVKFEF